MGPYLARAVADDLLVLEPELFPGHVQVRPGHESREGHADLEVQLLARVHAHRLVLVRVAKVVVGVAQLRVGQGGKVGPEKKKSWKKLMLKKIRLELGHPGDGV